MPSMPVFFWNDPDGAKYRGSYFDTYPGVWRHGDWIRITRRDTLVILGRSDATLNRRGVRIGTAEIPCHRQDARNTRQPDRQPRTSRRLRLDALFVTLSPAPCSTKR